MQMNMPSGAIKLFTDGQIHPNRCKTVIDPAASFIIANKSYQHFTNVLPCHGEEERTN